MASALVVAPQADEAEALVSGFVRKGLPSQDVSIGRMKCWFIPVLDVLVAVGGNGKAQFALQTQYLIDLCPEARLVICAGAAGRLSNRLNIGDLVVATATIEHDYKEHFISEPLPCYEADAEILLQFRRVASYHQFPFGVHFGRIASGDEDIVDASRADEVRRTTSALCVAWEGSGGARAARFSTVGFLEIRAITDAADGQAAKSFHQNLSTVLPHIAELLIAWRAQRDQVTSGDHVRESI